MIFCFSGCETYNNFKKAFIDPPAAEETVIKVGIFEPTTGRQSYDAEDEIAGMELAHQLFGNVNGFRIELVYADNRSSIEEAKIAAKTLVDAKAVCLLGSVSSTLSLAASDILLEYRIPAIAATNTVNILTSTNEYYFRACYTEDFEEQGAAEFLVSKIKEAELAKKQEGLKKGEIATLTNEELMAAVQSKAAVVITSASGLTESQLFEEKINNIFGLNSQTLEEDIVTIYTLPDDPIGYDEFFANLADAKTTDAVIYCPLALDLASNLIEKTASCVAYEWQDLEIINDIDGDGIIGQESELMFKGRKLMATEDLADYGFTFIGNSNWEGIDNYDRVYYTSDFAKDTVTGSELIYTGTNTALGLPEMTAPALSKSVLQNAFETAYWDKYGKSILAGESNIPGNSFDIASASQNLSSTQEALSEAEVKKAALASVNDNFKLGFDSYYILYKALEKVEKITYLITENGTINGLYLHSLIGQTVDLETLTKSLSYNSYGDPIRSVYVYGLIEGPVEESPEDPEFDEALENPEEILYDEEGNEIVPDTRVYGVVYISTPNA